MYIRVMQVGLNIGDGYQGFKVDTMVIQVRLRHVGGCQVNACYVDIRIMQDEQKTLGGFQGNFYVDIRDEMGTLYRRHFVDVSGHIC